MAAEGNGTPRELFDAVLRLPAEARAALAGALIESLDLALDENAETLWAEEIQHRIEALDGGRVHTIPWSQARRMIQGG